MKRKEERQGLARKELGPVRIGLNSALFRLNSAILEYCNILVPTT